MPYWRRYSPTELCYGAEMAIFLRPVFTASRVHCISDMHSKFALGPHHVCKYGRHPSATAEIRRGDKNSSGDEIANVNFYAVRPEATRIR